VKQRVILIKHKGKLDEVEVTCSSWSRQDFKRNWTNAQRSLHGTS